MISGAGISELAMHFIEKYKLMALRVASKFELRRLCRALSATSIVRSQAPIAEELGYAAIVKEEEIGGTRVVSFRQDEAETGVSTIVLRSSTDQFLDEVERAIDDGVNAFKVLGKDSRVLPGGW